MQDLAWHSTGAPHATLPARAPPRRPPRCHLPPPPPPPQVNVWVGPFFVLSGYVAGYTATELGKYEASARVKPAGAYTVARVAGFYPLFALIQVGAALGGQAGGGVVGVVSCGGWLLWHGLGAGWEDTRQAAGGRRQHWCAAAPAPPAAQHAASPLLH